MLRKLGTRLTLLNLLISGAILVVMALVALGVSERLVSEKYENDLTSFAASMVSIMHDAENDQGDSVLVQANGQYIVAMEGPDQVLHLVTQSAAGNDNGQQQAAATQAMELMEDQMDPYFSAVTLSTEDLAAEIYSISYFVLPSFDQGDGNLNYAFDEPLMEGQIAISSIAAEQIGAVEEGEETAYFSITVSQSRFLLATLEGTPYRINATRVSAPILENSGTAQGEESPTQTLLVLQDRTAEMSSLHRQRWLFAGLVVGGLLLILLASHFFSRRAIAPIEVSLRQQREFVAAASHELRTPIAAIRANAEVLQDAPLPQDFEPFLGSIGSEGERMTRLVNDLLDLARADAGELSMQPSPVDVQTVAGEALQLMRPLAEKKALTLLDDLHQAFILADRQRLRQALLALLDNALRYTPGGGEVRLSIQSTAHHVSIAVADTGIGIEDAHKQRIFDRFYRADAARSRDQGGAGLGLSVARQLVEQMHGTLTVQDNPSGGSIFVMRFARLTETDLTK